jgi:hypothetical protein
VFKNIIHEQVEELFVREVRRSRPVVQQAFVARRATISSPSPTLPTPERLTKIDFQQHSVPTPYQFDAQNQFFLGNPPWNFTRVNTVTYVRRRSEVFGRLPGLNRIKPSERDMIFGLTSHNPKATVQIVPPQPISRIQGRRPDSGVFVLRRCGSFARRADFL